jgi:glycosyltransferase involved in cell wall biosynthesis
MRVGIIIEWFYPDNTGGTGPVVSDLARHLKDAYKDVEIDVITSSNLYRDTDTSLPEEENWDGINIYRLKTAHQAGLSIIGRLFANLSFTFHVLSKLLRLGKYDLILTGTNPPMSAIAASAYKTITGTPFAYMIHDLEPDRSVTLRMFSKTHPFVTFFRIGQRSWLKSATRVIALGDCMRDYVVQAYNLPRSKVDVIHIGANENAIVPGDRNSNFKKKNNIEGFVALYTGNFGRYHNFNTILDAAKTLQNEKEEVQFVLVGAGNQKSHIVQRVTEEKISNVKIFDFVPAEEYSDLLATADVSLVTLEPGMETLCLPSKFYTILASARPVLAILSAKSDVAMITKEVNCGIQVDQGSQEKMVEAVRWLISHPDERAAMGENARKVFLNRFATNIIAEQYYKTFSRISASTETEKHTQAGQVQTEAPR